MSEVQEEQMSQTLVSENNNATLVNSENTVLLGFLPITVITIIAGSLLILFTYFWQPEGRIAGVHHVFLVFSALAVSLSAIAVYLLRNKLSPQWVPVAIIILSMGNCYLIALCANDFTNTSWMLAFPALLTVTAGAVHISKSWWITSVATLWFVWLAVRISYGNANMLIPDIIILLSSVSISYFVLKTRIIQLKKLLMFTNIAVNNSQTDPMTGLLNRRGLSELGATKAYLAHEEGYSVAVTLFDVNGLKKINDSYGHEVGDDGIRLVAETLKATTRQNDWVARWGGDEFVVLSYGKEIPTGEEFHRRFNTYLENYTVRKGHVWVPSVSVGQASVDAKTNFSLTSLLAIADETMYNMKEKVKKTTAYTKNTNVALGTGIREVDMPKTMKTADKNL